MVCWYDDSVIPVMIVLIKYGRSAYTFPTDRFQRTRYVIMCSTSKLSWVGIKTLQGLHHPLSFSAIHVLHMWCLCHCHDALFLLGKLSWHGRDVIGTVSSSAELTLGSPAGCT